MKRLIEWLRRDTPQQSTANAAEQEPVGMKTRPESEDEHSDDSSLSGSWADKADSSIFDTGSLKIEKSADANTIPLATLKLTDEPLSDEDMGVDPYNTGRFDTGNK